ncbi:hypothetical protein ACJ5NV_05095 [Loktanella agnita]|uniref:hypothetical protein n=1 Tax=Loktanella agnita TaxID=287097 RepID=UPI003988961F
MSKCKNQVCADCTCGRKRDRTTIAMAANANFATTEKPKRIVRQSVRESAVRLEIQLKESMQILA